MKRVGAQFYQRKAGVHADSRRKRQSGRNNKKSAIRRSQEER